MKYHVERSTEIDAPLSTVRPLIEDFNNWNSWSPWTIVEPECKVEVNGFAGKVGHSMEWNGEIIGSGKNTIERVDGDDIYYDLEFLAPFKSKAKTAFTFAEENGKTTVTWTLDSKMPFYLFFLTKIMKNWIGMDYDRGLRMLKEMAEKGSIPATTTNNGIVDIEGFSYVGIQRTISFDDISTAAHDDFMKIIEDVVKERGKGAKSWATIYTKMDMRNMKITYIAAISDEELKDVDLGSDYVRGEIKAGKALEIKYDGPYDFIGNAWSMGAMYTQAKKVKKAGVPFEQYWNSPLETEPNDLKSSIFFPVKN